MDLPVNGEPIFLLLASRFTLTGKPIFYIQNEEVRYADALTEAKSGNIPRKRGKLQEQVIALTANNADLSKRLKGGTFEKTKIYHVGGDADGVYECVYRRGRSDGVCL